MWRAIPWLLACAIVTAISGCKVAITDIGGFFALADAAWFAEEETLFFFYEIHAEQGLGDETVVEVQYTTDEGTLPWTALADLPHVHTHLPVSCGVNTRCGSGSVHVPIVPRNVAIRLRYHRAGELSLDASTVYNVVGPGPAHTHRSALVYGVFDVTNRAVQWRLRHRFPTIRNAEAERLGLRRRFTIDERRIGSSDFRDLPSSNPYLYAGIDCSGARALDGALLETEERAIFDADLAEDLAAQGAVCARSTVTDATGQFEAEAVARRNPEVRPAFPVLRSPVRDATRITYVLRFCERNISSTHLGMQRQRTLAGDVQAICLDDWTGPGMDGGLTDMLETRFRDDVDRVRAEGNDMVIALALHHDERAIRGVIEAALARTLDSEQDRNTPRLAGAFVFDSYAHAIDDPLVTATTVWCPAQIDTEVEDEDDLADLSFSGLACAAPDPAIPTSLGLGPFDLGVLPILPDRARYLDFINTFSEAQAGTMRDLIFRVPERPASAEHIDAPPFGTASFFNDEVISADADDEFSFCQTDEYPGFVFRSQLSAAVGLLPLEALPQWHAEFGESSYSLGIVWEFPFLLRIEYEVVASLAVSAFSVTLPLGLGFGASEDLGSTLWGAEEFPLARTLTQCVRFCRHPTFDSAGVYQVRQLFEVYQNTCYAPKQPVRGDSGFPLDP